MKSCTLNDTGGFKATGDNRQSGSCVAILLCTYQGERHLADLLLSLERQTYKNIRLYISDDGSTDKTLEIIQQFQKSSQLVAVELFDGPQKGFQRNFISLLDRPEIKADYYALCDQDDIWLPEKVEKALDKLDHAPASKPAYYFSNVDVVDESNRLSYRTNLKSYNADLRNVVVENVVHGNTIVINDAMRLTLLKANLTNVVSHDWAIALVGVLAEVSVVFDSGSYIRYRQHNMNVIGANAGSFRSLGRLFNRSIQRNLKTNQDFLKDNRFMTEKPIDDFIDKLCKYRTEKFGKHFYFFCKSKVFRKSVWANFALYVAAFFRLI